MNATMSSLKRTAKTENGNKPELKTKNVSADDLYRRSSQYQIWSYATDELNLAKIRVNEQGKRAALARFEESVAKMQKEKPEIFQKHGSELTDIAEIITFEEEQKYLHFFSQQIVLTCTHFNMPTQVKATAMAFFKRFYLVNSVMEYHPKNTLYTVVFLAAKLENYFISIELFCNRLPKTQQKDILDLEFIVLQSVKFTLLVHHPYRPLYGFFLDFQLVLLHPSPVMYDVNVDTIGSLYDQAKKWLNDYSLLTDVSFLFTPPQIALAALYDIDKRITDKYLKRKFLRETHLEEPLKTIEENVETGKTKEREHYETMVRTVRRCIKVAKVETATSKEESTQIDKKCFFSLNPTKLLKRKIKALETKDSAETTPTA